MGYDHYVIANQVLKPQSDAEMRQLGAELALLLKAGDIVLLYGDLGAGKTTLVRGAAAALGYLEPVRSPTFNLIQIFDTQPPILHADLYRVGSSEGLGIEDYAGTHIFFVEWPESDPDWVRPDRVWTVEIEFEGNGRKVSVRRPNR